MEPVSAALPGVVRARALTLREKVAVLVGVARQARYAGLHARVDRRTVREMLTLATMWTGEGAVPPHKAAKLARWAVVRL